MTGALTPVADSGRGNLFARTSPQRPPWTDETRIRANCTSCGDCIRVCPEAILISGPARTPAVDFSLGACTFCGDCAAACQADVFLNTSGPPWAYQAQIEDRCLMAEGVSCRTCTDACDDEALIFDMRVRPVGAIHLSAGDCTGCGACVAVCPVAAIRITQASEVRP